MTKILTRFAPSPTGLLHVGNVRTALVNFLLTAYHKKQGADAQFMLRIDDTDLERSRDEYRTQIEDDMQWLGLSWDKYMKQSDRLVHYNDIKQKLIEQGRLYPCYETPDELETKRKFMIKRGVAPIYDRSALKLTEEQKQSYESEGRKPHYRFKLDHAPIEWNDLVRGQTKFDGRNLTDPILFRENSSPTYTICSVIDDGDMGVTHIVRGEDHVTNTAIQVQMFKIMGYDVPECAHIALIKTKEGELSKRTGGFDIKGLRAAGFEADAITSLLGKIGTSDAIDVKTLEKLAAEFDFSKFSRSTANYMPDELERLNHKIVTAIDYSQVQGRLDSDIDQNFWETVRPNLTKLDDINEWAEICKKPLTPQVAAEDAEFLSASADHLPTGEWNEDSFSMWTNALKERTDRKGKTLFMPIRLALTARTSGPELKHILPLIGYEKVISRLKGVAA